MKLLHGASALALAAALALAPVATIAQTATDDTLAPGAETAPGSDMGTAPGTAPDAGVGTAPDAAPDTALPPADLIDPAPGAIDDTVGEAEIAPVPGIMQTQPAGTMLASDLMGNRVYNLADENIGVVEDLVMAEDGRIEGVVIGVGGFLGLGRKLVAVEMDQVTVRSEPSGAATLLLDAPSEALRAAPEFMTAEMQAREADRLNVEQVAPTAGTTDPSMTEAPAAPPVDQ